MKERFVMILFLPLWLLWIGALLLFWLLGDVFKFLASMSELMASKLSFGLIDFNSKGNRNVLDKQKSYTKIVRQ